jgi:uncharacterized RDD family membrane protein YckC
VTADDPILIPEPRRLREVPKDVREFQGERAGIVSRLLANVVDLAVVAGAVIALWLGWLALLFLVDPRRTSYPQPKWLAVIIVGSWISIAYFTASWATTGRTFGNHVLGLRVVNFRGEHLRWAGALLRAVFCVYFPIGLLWTVVSRQNRSLQDAVLRTSVIYDWVTDRARPRRR